ncbi:Yip1 domain-containing protein [bacterium JGI 053]|nr:Yip1 domain-containing protein [bacterium JGI 053]
MTLPVAETAAPPAASPAPARPAPLASRIADTFFSPGRVFEQFREGPAPWLGPVLVCAALLVLFTAIRPLFVSDAQMVEFALQKMSEMGMQQLPTSEQMATQLTIQTIFGTAFAVAWMFARVWLVGLILFALYGLMMGGRTDVRPYAAVASHAFLVSALGSLLLTALQYATGRLDLTLDAALLAPGLDPRGVAAAVLHAVTPFSVWMAALLALGGATLNRRRGWMGVAALLLALQLALTLAFSLVTHLAAGRAAAG